VIWDSKGATFYRLASGRAGVFTAGSALEGVAFGTRCLSIDAVAMLARILSRLQVDMAHTIAGGMLVFGRHAAGHRQWLFRWRKGAIGPTLNLELARPIDKPIQAVAFAQGVLDLVEIDLFHGIPGGVTDLWCDATFNWFALLGSCEGSITLAREGVDGAPRIRGLI
jgi:hypothetical protein